MEKEQLTLEMLCSYLPYGLNVTFEADEFQHELVGLVAWCDEVMVVSPFNDYGRSNIKNIKPIFRNLKTDLTREIEHNGELYLPSDEFSQVELEKYKDRLESGLTHNALIKTLDYESVVELMKRHYWIYDQSYFEKGIIIDFNEVNPSNKK